MNFTGNDSILDKFPSTCTFEINIRISFQNKNGISKKPWKALVLSQFNLKIEQSQTSFSSLPFGPGHAKTCLMSYANNKGADQPAHPRSLISTFVVRCIDSMICKLTISKVSRF